MWKNECTLNRATLSKVKYERLGVTSYGNNKVFYFHNWMESNKLVGLGLIIFYGMATFKFITNSKELSTLIAVAKCNLNTNSSCCHLSTWTNGAIVIFCFQGFWSAFFF